MTSVSKNVYIDKLDDIVSKYNNTYRRTIKMKPADIMFSTYIDFSIENNDKDSKFRIGDYVSCLNIKNNFSTDCIPNR